MTPPQPPHILDKVFSVTWSGLFAQVTLPAYFRDATRLVHCVGSAHKVSSYFNPLTNTTMTGAVSSEARAILKSRSRNYRSELSFYESCKRNFWQHAVCSLGDLSVPTAPAQNVPCPLPSPPAPPPPQENAIVSLTRAALSLSAGVGWLG